jgi:hypothetical protein
MLETRNENFRIGAHFRTVVNFEMLISPLDLRMLYIRVQETCHILYTRNYRSDENNGKEGN